MSTVAEVPSRSQQISTSSYKALRIGCWLVAVVLGAAQAWATRFNMNPDGISYLDIGDAYWRGDWHNAINAYWSPLYSWILGFFVKMLKPSPSWDYPVAHLVNFLIYVATLACFEFFLVTFVGQRKQNNQESGTRALMGIPPNSWWLLGYSLFISCSLFLIGLAQLTPDMCVAGFVFLASGLIMRITRADVSRTTYLALGLSLGFAYLAKSVMLPLGIIFLSVGLLAARCVRNAKRNALVAVVAFAVVALPFITVISYRTRRLTFGDSGKLTYAACINGVDPWYPGDGGSLNCSGTGYVIDIDGPSRVALEHPARKLVDSPATYWFGTPVSGTYPFWYDPSYWQAGVRARVNLKAQLPVFGAGILVCLHVVQIIQLGIVALFLVLFLISNTAGFLHRFLGLWTLVVPSVAAIFLYALVHTEPRYVAAFVCVLWLALFSALRFRESDNLKTFISVGCACALLTTIVFLVVFAWYGIRASMEPPAYEQAAAAIRELNLPLGGKIATVSAEPFGAGGAFVARLTRLQIVGQVNQSERYWAATPEAQLAILKSFHDVGCTGVLGLHVPESARGWRKLGNSGYSIFLLRDLGE